MNVYRNVYILVFYALSAGVLIMSAVYPRAEFELATLYYNI